MLENTKQSKVTRITEQKEFEKLFPEILDGLRDGSIKDFVIIAHQKIPKEQADENHTYQVKKYWFGQSGSCVMVLGLLQYMINEVQNFILEDKTW